MVNWRLKTRNLRPIGLDIGHNFIKMIQLVADAEHISVLAADKVQVDPAINGDEPEKRSFVVSAIKRMLAEGNFRRRNVVSCLPSDKLKITSLRLAKAEDDEIEQALKKEVAQRFGMDPDRGVINYVVAGDVMQGDEIKNELVLFAADDEAIKNHIGTLEAAGLKPIGIDTVPCALFRSFERLLRRKEDRERTVVFVDVGWQFTTVVFGRGGKISFVKQIPIGGEKFNSQIAAKLGIGVDEAQMLRARLRLERLTPGYGLQGQLCSEDSEPQGRLDASTRQVMVDAVVCVAEELAKEISLCFRYYTVTFRGQRAERAVFAGGEAYENILLGVLRRQLPVEIELAQPLRNFDMSRCRGVNFDSDRRGLLCEWAVAVGLSLKEC